MKTFFLDIFQTALLMVVTGLNFCFKLLVYLCLYKIVDKYLLHDILSFYSLSYEELL